MRLRKLLKLWNKDSIKLTKARKNELENMDSRLSDHEVKMYLAKRRLERETKNADV